MRAMLTLVALLGSIAASACGAAAVPQAHAPSERPTLPPNQESPLSARPSAPTSIAASPATPQPPPAAAPPVEPSLAPREASGLNEAGSQRPTPAPASAAARQLLHDMSLEEKVGQVFMLGVDGTEPAESTLGLIRTIRPGGVTLFARNMETPPQVRRLVDGLQTAATEQRGRARLFISIDQEGGLIGRISQGVTLLPGNMALGATDEPELARAAGLVLGRELAAMGVNMNLAPVVDVNSNPANPVIGVRSFGSTPERVGELGAALIAGLQQGGVLAVAKHFPGHGDTSVDSHFDLPVVEHDRARLDRVELAPFRAAVAGGVDAIMTAHVVVPALEPREQLPATLSANVLGGLLREELGFGGLVLTDALDMDAVKDTVGVARGAVEAFKAGSDMLLIAGIKPEDLALRAEAYQALLSAVRSGEVSEARLDASVLRILDAKDRHGMLGDTAPSASAEQPSADEHRQVAHTIASRSITLVRDQAGLLPLDAAQSVLIVRPRPPLSSHVEELTETGNLGQAVRGLAPRVREVVVSVQPSAAEIEQALQAAKAVDRVVLASYDAWRWPRQQALVNALLGSGTPTLVVGMRAPYDLLALPDIPTYLAVYSDRPASLEAVAAALFGKSAISGKLPVDLPGLYPSGHGLSVPARD